MRRNALASRATVSQICERFSRFCRELGRAGLAVALLLAGSGMATAAPEDDYKSGVQAVERGDVTAAMASLRKAAEAGHLLAQVRLARILDDAEFNDEAVEWYRKASERGSAEGEYGLGTMYLAGEGVKKDVPQGYRLITQAAEKDFEPAVLALASAYLLMEKGELEVELDKGRAVDWLQRAAKFDHLPSIDALANAHRLGRWGLSPDVARAEQYAAQAAAIRKKLAAANKGTRKR